MSTLLSAPTQARVPAKSMEWATFLNCWNRSRRNIQATQNSWRRNRAESFVWEKTHRSKWSAWYIAVKLYRLVSTFMQWSLHIGWRIHSFERETKAFRKKNEKTVSGKKIWLPLLAEAFDRKGSSNSAAALFYSSFSKDICFQSSVVVGKKKNKRGDQKAKIQSQIRYVISIIRRCLFLREKR